MGTRSIEIGRPHWAHPVLHGRVCPTLRRDTPIPHHGNGRADLSDMGLGGLVLSLTWGGVPSCPDWPYQLSLRSISSALAWMTLIIYSIYDLPDCGRDCSYWTIAAGSLWLRATTGCPRGALVRVQWLWCARDKRSWARAITHCNEQLWVIEQKGLHDRPQLPMTLGKIRRC